jgi:integrase
LPGLKRFDKFCVSNFSGASNLTRDIVLSWLDGETSEEGSMAAPATTIRQFGKYLWAVGEDAYILPERFTPKRSKHTPYIFTDGELSLLFGEIDKLKGNSREPFMSEVAPVIFRLIYTCGLRPNEGRCLEYSNVNLKTGEVLITNTKRAKDRIVVMSDDMLNMCREYDKVRNVFSGSSPFFFPSKTGEAFSSNQMASTLARAWNKAASSSENPAPRSIRVYDLRHRFASACLNRWLDEGRDLMVMLPYLRAYMGHNSMTETAYYIHILPENLVKTSAIDWAAFNALLPEVSACPK